MPRDRLDPVCERAILVLVVATLTFAILATGAVRPPEFVIVQALVCAAVVLWVVRLWLKPKARLFWPPIGWALAGFVAYAVVRYRQSDVEFVSRQELIRVLTYACLFLVVLNNLTRQESTQVVCFTLLFVGMGVSMYAIYQFATRSPHVWHFIKPEAFRSRGSGTYINPNHLAGLLEMLAPLGLAFFLTGRVAPVLRIVLGYAVLIILAGIVVTVSRGAWVGTGVALLFFFAALIRSRNYRIPALAALVVLVAAGVYFYSKAGGIQKRVEDTLSSDSADTAQIRLWLWKPAVRMWLDHPWWGVGPGLFDCLFPAYRPPQVHVRPGHVHNDYLNTLADWGVAGAVLVALCWVLLFLGVWKTWRFVRREPNDLVSKGSNRAAFVCGATMGLVAILVHSFFDFNMHIPANALLAVTLMALLSGHLRYATEGFWVTANPALRVCLSLAALVAVGYLGVQDWRRARESAWLERAARETTYSPALISALKSAAAVEPFDPDTTYAIGEALRHWSWQGDEGYEKVAEEAAGWFQRGMQLNPYDPYNYMKLGMCLDLLGRHTGAAPLFEEAVRRDPNNYYVAAHYGWHFVQTGDYAAAKHWFERSIQIKWWDNPLPYNYLEIVKRKLAESQSPAGR